MIHRRSFAACSYILHRYVEALPLPSVLLLFSSYETETSKQLARHRVLLSVCWRLRTHLSRLANGKAFLRGFFAFASLAGMYVHRYIHTCQKKNPTSSRRSGNGETILGILSSTKEAKDFQREGEKFGYSCQRMRTCSGRTMRAGTLPCCCPPWELIMMHVAYVCM